MSEIQTLYERNAQFAEHFSFAELNIKPKLSTVVLTCMDSRVDPAYFLGLEPGEALVLRNAGGRVTEDVERDLAFIWTMTAQMTGGVPDVSLAIVHHADCGLERLADPAVLKMVSQRSGIALTSLQRLAIQDHDLAFGEDIERLKDSSLVPNGLIVSTHLYEPQNGRTSQLLAPVPLASEGIHA